MSNQIQIPKEVLNDLMSVYINSFDIWILGFGIAFIKIVVCPFSQVVEAIF
jgi:hypothetical protein